MKVVTQAEIKSLPEMGATEEQGDKAVARVHWFSSSWDWWATEYGAKDQIFFGLVHGFEDEMGYFSLGEMAEVMKEKPYGLSQGGIERDLHWKNKTIGEIKEMLERREERRGA